MIRVHLKFKETQLVTYLERTPKSSIKKVLRSDYPNRGSEVQSPYPRVYQRTEGTKIVGVIPTDFSNGRKEAVRLPTGNG